MPTDPVTALEDAIYTWVVTGSGLDADHVIWGGEGRSPGPAPVGTYISMRLIREETSSQDWLTPRRDGDTVVAHVRGSRYPTLELTCSAGANYGSQRASAILSRVLAAIRLPSVSAVLRGAGLGVGVRGPIRTVPGVRSMLFDPKAVVEIGLHTMIDISEVASEIVTAQVQTETDEGTRSGTVEKP